MLSVYRISATIRILSLVFLKTIMNVNFGIFVSKRKYALKGPNFKNKFKRDSILVVLRQHKRTSKLCLSLPLSRLSRSFEITFAI